MIEKIIEKIITTITDPLMLFSLLMILGLFNLLIRREKNMGIIFAAIKEQADRLASVNTSLAGLVPLLEILVYGREGKRR